MRFVAGLLLALGAVVGAQATPQQPAPPRSLEELDGRLAETFKAAGVPGASLALFENGEVVLAKGYGVSDVRANTPVTPETVFRAGSISKSIVGIAVMMLVEEGKLDLDAKLRDLAPEVHFSNEWEATDPVRLANLMEHTTGFDDIRFSQYLIGGENVPLLKAIKLYGPYESRWKPGTYFAYSNAPPVIAGYLVEKASGLSWADFTRKRIFEPLGMESANWDKAPEIASRLSKSYAPDGKTEQPYMDIPGKPAGSLNVTPSDLAKMAIMLAGRGTCNGVTLLKPESVERLESPKTTLASRLGLSNGYGLGNLAMAREKTVFHGHDGGIDGFVAEYLYDPASGSGFVLMVNAQNAKAFQAAELVTSYLQRDLPAPALEEIKTDPTRLEKLAGYYQSISPRNQILAPLLNLLAWHQAQVKDGRLAVDGVARFEVAPNIFRRADRAAPSSVFTKVDGATLMLSPVDAYRRVPLVEFVAKASYAALFNLTTALGMLYLLLWAPSALLGRLRSRGGVWPRIVPLLALASVAGLFGLVLWAVSDVTAAGLAQLGTMSPLSVGIYAVSWTVPAFGVLALAMGLFPRDGVSLFPRLLALSSGLCGVIATLYLAPYGWIGLRLWA